MNVLLTGAFGNIGTGTLPELIKQGHKVRALDLRSFACVPLRWDGAVRGVLHVDATSEESTFLQRDVRTLGAVASILGAVLDASGERYEAVQDEDEVREPTPLPVRG